MQWYISNLEIFFYDLYIHKLILKISWGLFHIVLIYEPICDESAKIRVPVVFF